jgi:hypothetical protein
MVDICSRSSNESVLLLVRTEEPWTYGNPERKASPEEKEQGGSAGVIHFAVVCISVSNEFHRTAHYEVQRRIDEHNDDKIVRYPRTHTIYL